LSPYLPDAAHHWQMGFGTLRPLALKPNTLAEGHSRGFGENPKYFAALAATQASCRWGKPKRQEYSVRL